LAEVKVGTAPGRAIAKNFMGLSHEWHDAQNITGDKQNGVNTIYRQLLENLAMLGAGPLTIRVGGNSADHTQAATAGTVEPFVEASKALGLHYILSVNLGANDLNLSEEQAKTFVKYMPAGSLDAIEIGNEPDDFFKNGMRPKTYSDQDYFQDFRKWRDGIVPLLPAGMKLAGPAWAFTHPAESITTLLDENAEAWSIFTQHVYVTHPEAKPPDDILLQPASVTKGIVRVTDAIAAVHAHGVLYRVGEMNSISHGGEEGISNAFGSALWSIDDMFEYANAGVDGVNWITGSGNIYSPFYFTISKKGTFSSYALRSVNPLYYGLLFFQAATGKGARLLPVDLTTQSNVKAWATVDQAGTPRVSLINKEEDAAGNVMLSVPGYTHATVLRLTAPSYKALKGVTFAGQTFDESGDGKIRGKQVLESVSSTMGTFSIAMPSTSAALVVFSK
jgi:hypothetical protein